MNPFIDQAQSYAAYHQKPATRYVHGLGILLITLSLMILLSFVRIIIIDVLNISLAGIAALAVLIYYFRLNWRLALVVTPIFIVLLWLAEFLTYRGPTKFSLWSFIIVFALGCISQFIGYFIERKRPPFRDGLKQLLVAPLIAIADILFFAGKMKPLKKEIYTQASLK